MKLPFPSLFSSGSHSSSHILFVEDQTATAEMLASFFGAQGYDTTAVGWGMDALAFVEQTIPDLILLDIRLPDIDGFEVLRRLRADRRTEHIPVIFLTERRLREDRLMGLELGAVDYVTKPFDVQELKLRVRNVLGQTVISRAVNPVTGLPGLRVTEGQLTELLFEEGWAVLFVGVNLVSFTRVYGTVAHDDVLRAVALMLRHAASELGTPDDFIGHYKGDDLVVITTVEKAPTFREQVVVRLSEGIPFFYPRADWQTGQADSNVELPPVLFTIGIAPGGTFADAQEIIEAAIKAGRTLGRSGLSHPDAVGNGPGVQWCGKL